MSEDWFQPTPHWKGSVKKGALPAKKKAPPPIIPNRYGRGGGPNGPYGGGFGPTGAPGAMQAQQAAWDAMPAGYDDPAGGLSPAELALLTWQDQQNRRSNSTSNGSGSGGGAVSAETAAAYRQMLNAIANQGTAETAALDASGTNLGVMQGQGDARLRAIMAELAASRGSAQAAAQAGFANTDGQLQQMASQYAQTASARDAGMNRSLGAFGVEALNGNSGGELEGLFGAMRGSNTMLGNVSDQAYNNRANVHAGLNADVQLRDQQQYMMLQAQLAAQRQAAANADAQRRAQLALQAAQEGVAL